MKQQDIFAIVTIAIVGTIASFIAVNALLGDPTENPVEIPTIGSISPSMLDPDPELFNRDAINPTVEIYVGDCEDTDKNGILDLNELVRCGVYDPSVLEGTEFEEEYNNQLQNEEPEKTEYDDDDEDEEDEDEEDEDS